MDIFEKVVLINFVVFAFLLFYAFVFDVKYERSEQKIILMTHYMTVVWFGFTPLITAITLIRLIIYI